MVEDQPRDWNTAQHPRRSLRPRRPDRQGGRAVHPDRRSSRPRRLLPSAAALYKKILKIRPDEESVQLKLGEISAQQGLLADAKAYFSAVADRRRARGDHGRAPTRCVVRLGIARSVRLRRAGTRRRGARAERGHRSARRSAIAQLHADLLEKGRAGRGVAALREAVRLNPDDTEGRVELGARPLATGDLETARDVSRRARRAGGDPAAAVRAAGDRAARLRRARSGARDLRAAPGRGLSTDAGSRRRYGLGAIAGNAPEAAFVCIDAAVDARRPPAAYRTRQRSLQEFVVRVPGQIPALLKLVEVCVDGGLEADDVRDAGAAGRRVSRQPARPPRRA